MFLLAADLIWDVRRRQQVACHAEYYTSFEQTQSKSRFNKADTTPHCLSLKVEREETKWHPMPALLLCYPQSPPGLINLAHFSEIRRNLMDSGRSEFIVHCFKISEKDKNQQKNM
jgi:hypothetical protein